MDFVEDIVRPGSEDGLRLDVAPGQSHTLVTDRIAPENMQRLIRRIQAVRGAA